MKPLTGLFVVTTILLGGGTYINYQRTEALAQIISDREKTITEYQKVITALGRTGVIDSHKLEAELKKDFDLADPATYDDYSGEHYLILMPKDDKINKEAIWDFVGLELILDKNKKVNRVTLHKP